MERSNVSYEGVLEICEDMQAFPGEPLKSFVGWYRRVYGDGECWDRRYSTVIQRYSNPAWDQVGTDNGSKYFLVHVRQTQNKNYFPC